MSTSTSARNLKSAGGAVDELSAIEDHLRMRRDARRVGGEIPASWPRGCARADVRQAFPLLVVLLLLGCGGGIKMRVPDVKVVPARTVVLPVTVVGYDLDSNDEHLNEDVRTRALERTVALEFEQQARKKGALPVSLEKVRACGDNCVSLLSTAIRWGAKSTTEIAVASAGTNRSGRSSVGEWQSGRNFQPLQRALDADFALVLFVRDARETASRQLGQSQLDRRAFKAIRNDDDFTRIAATCALELATGRIVWCSAMAARWMGKYVDITSPDECSSVVKELLADF